MDMFRTINQRLAALERHDKKSLQIGTVDKVDRSKCRVRVLFPIPERVDKETGQVTRFAVSEMLPVLVKQSVGNRDYWMPTIGDQVLCIFPTGVGGAGFVLGSFYSDEEEIPEGAEAEGVRMVEFEDGTRIEYDTEASRLRVLVGELETEFTAEHVRMGGEDADQPFVRGTDLKTLLSALIDLVVAHTHPTGVGPSGPPVNATSITAKKNDIDGTLSPIIKGR